MSATDSLPAPAPTSSNRHVERNLLIMAYLVGLVAYLSVDLVVLGRLSPVFPLAIVVFGALLLIAHAGVRILAPFADPFLLPAAAMLNTIGLVMIHRLDLADQLRAERNGTELPRADAEAQFTWLVLAIALFVLTLLIIRDHRRLQRFT